MGTWLSAPATPTMQSVFRPHPLQADEIFSLLAVIEDAGNKGQVASAGSMTNFFLLGFGGMAVGLVIMGAMWRGRFRAVRQTLVHRGHRGDL